jgi:hypothetical protein
MLNFDSLMSSKETCSTSFLPGDTEQLDVVTANPEDRGDSPLGNPTEEKCSI